MGIPKHKMRKTRCSSIDDLACEFALKNHNNIRAGIGAKMIRHFGEEATYTAIKKARKLLKALDPNYEEPKPKISIIGDSIQTGTMTGRIIQNRQPNIQPIPVGLNYGIRGKSAEMVIYDEYFNYSEEQWKNLSGIVFDSISNVSEKPETEQED